MACFRVEYNLLFEQIVFGTLSFVGIAIVTMLRCFRCNRAVSMCFACEQLHASIERLLAQICSNHSRYYMLFDLPHSKCALFLVPFLSYAFCNNIHIHISTTTAEQLCTLENMHLCSQYTRLNWSQAINVLYGYNPANRIYFGVNCVFAELFSGKFHNKTMYKRYVFIFSL